MYFIFNSMGYIVPFLTISSILIDLCLTNLIFISAIFNSYNYWYLFSYSNQFTLHYSILFLIISIIIIVFFYYYIKCYIKFTSSTMHSINSSYPSFLSFHSITGLLFNYSLAEFYINTNLYSLFLFIILYLIHLIISYIIVSIYSFIYLFNLISYTFFSNFTFFIPIFLDFFLIFSIFFFKGTINCIEVFTGFNPCYSILFYNFFSLFFQFQIIILYFI